MPRGHFETIARSPLLVIRQLMDERIRQKESRERLATRIGYSHTSINEWESGKNVPRLASVIDWADAYGFELALKRKEESNGNL